MGGERCLKSLEYLLRKMRTSPVLCTTCAKYIKSTDIKKSKMEVSHRTKNGKIIVKFKDRPSHDRQTITLFANKYNLLEKTQKILGLAMRTQYL